MPLSPLPLRHGHFSLRQPEGHVHGAIHLDGGGEHGLDNLVWYNAAGMCTCTDNKLADHAERRIDVYGSGDTGAHSARHQNAGT